MLPFVLTVEGQALCAAEFTKDEWRTLKDTYRLGQFLTPCCSTPAIPKTSVNEVQFFAHHSDECTTSPESVWHVATKNIVWRELKAKGLNVFLERSIGRDRDTGKADILIACVDRTIAIEVQHSNQTLDDYIKRQRKYERLGVRNYWLLYPSRYSTIMKSLAKRILRRDYDGRVPADGFYPCIAELPLASFVFENDSGVVYGAGGMNVPIADWLQSILDETFNYSGGIWTIASPP